MLSVRRWTVWQIRNMMRKAMKRRDEMSRFVSSSTARSTRFTFSSTSVEGSYSHHRDDDIASGA